MSTNASLRTVALVMAAFCFWSVSAAGQRRKPPDTAPIACTFEGQTYFPFGYYDPFSPVDMRVQTYIGYRCYEIGDRAVTSRLTRLARLPRRPDARKPKNLEISISEGSAGTFDRRMRGVSDSVIYNVYLDAACTEVWGDGTRGTSVYSKAIEASETVQSVTVYGMMPAGQNSNGGAYADMLVLTLDF